MQEIRVLQKLVQMRQITVTSNVYSVLLSDAVPPVPPAHILEKEGVADLPFRISDERFMPLRQLPCPPIPSTTTADADEAVAHVYLAHDVSTPAGALLFQESLQLLNSTNSAMQLCFLSTDNDIGPRLLDVYMGASSAVSPSWRDIAEAVGAVPAEALAQHLRETLPQPSAGAVQAHRSLQRSFTSYAREVGEELAHGMLLVNSKAYFMEEGEELTAPDMNMFIAPEYSKVCTSRSPSLLPNHGTVRFGFLWFHAVCVPPLKMPLLPSLFAAVHEVLGTADKDVPRLHGP